jgi:YesN/AraC family two-component response regulator
MDSESRKLKELVILIVDDEAFILDTMAHFLKRRAKTVDTAEDGKIALEYIQQKHYDLVVTDIEMPNLNGYDLYEATKKIDPAVKFIFLSGHDSEEIGEAFQPFALYKPIDKDLLIKKIASLF